MSGIVAIIVVADIVVACVSGFLWQSKGGGYGSGFLLGLFLGLIGLFYVAFAKPTTGPAAPRFPTNPTDAARYGARYGHDLKQEPNKTIRGQAAWDEAIRNGK